MEALMTTQQAVFADSDYEHKLPSRVLKCHRKTGSQNVSMNKEWSEEMKNRR